MEDSREPESCSVPLIVTTNRERSLANLPFALLLSMVSVYVVLCPLGYTYSEAQTAV